MRNICTDLTNFDNTTTAMNLRITYAPYLIVQLPVMLQPVSSFNVIDALHMPREQRGIRGT